MSRISDGTDIESIFKFGSSGLAAAILEAADYIRECHAKRYTVEAVGVRQKDGDHYIDLRVTRPTEATRLWVEMTDQWWEPSEDPHYWRTVEPCDDTCHNPVHAFNAPRRHHIESAIWITTHGVPEKPVTT